MNEIYDFAVKTLERDRKLVIYCDNMKNVPNLFSCEYFMNTKYIFSKNQKNLATIIS